MVQKRDSLSAALFSMFTFSAFGYFYIGQKQKGIFGLGYSLIIFANLLLIVFLIPEIINFGIWVLLIIVWIYCQFAPIMFAIMCTVFCVIPCTFPCILCFAIPTILCSMCCLCCWLLVICWTPIPIAFIYVCFNLFLSGASWFLFALPLLFSFGAFLISSIVFSIDIFLINERKAEGEEIEENELGLKFLAVLPGFGPLKLKN